MKEEEGRALTDRESSLSRRERNVVPASGSVEHVGFSAQRQPSLLIERKGIKSHEMALLNVFS